MNTDEPELALYRAERRVREIQTKLHRCVTGLVERPVLGDGHAGCGRRLGETHRWRHRQGAPGRPHYYLLEDEFEVQLLNAAHMRNVPGRKTDVSDAAWIAQLVEHGLVRPSLVPPPPIRRLRDLTRYRSALTGERTREKQRLEKVLEDAGIKLSVFISDVFGVSGRAMFAALIEGQRDPRVLAEYARARMRRKIPALVEALTGRFNQHHAFLCRMMLAHVDGLDAAIAEVTSQIEAEIKPFQAVADRLDTIPGVNQRVAQTIIAEIGVEMAGSRPRRTWRPGRGCVRATTSLPASTTVGAPARAIRGCGPRSARRPRPVSGRETPICRRSTDGWPGGEARSAPCSPSGTPSWSPPGT